MTIPANNFDRRAEAYAFLRGALSRCDQEGCSFLDIIQVVKSWADTKNIAKKPEWVTILPDRSNRPAVGDVVKMDDSASPYAGKIGKVAKIDDDDLGTLVQFTNGSAWYYDREVLVQSSK